jgi:hypothetical protein
MGEGGGGVGKNVMLQFVLVISLVKVKKSLCHVVTQCGGGVYGMTLNVTLGEV